ncbi:MAG: hypothetical protein RLZZ568_1428 [Cyanobacteriota bacterium]
MLVVVFSILVLGVLMLDKLHAAPAHQPIPVKVRDNQLNRR